MAHDHNKLRRLRSLIERLQYDGMIDGMTAEEVAEFIADEEGIKNDREHRVLVEKAMEDLGW